MKKINGKLCYLQDSKKRRKNELKVLTFLAGKNIDNLQEDIAVNSDEANTAAVQYAQLLPACKQDMERENHSTAGIILLA